MKTSLRCLIVDKMHPSIGTLLEEAGIHPDYFPDITRKEIIDIIASYDGLIIRSKTIVDKEIIDSARKLKFIARAGAGTDNLDVDYLNSNNIKVLNAGEGNRDAVGDHTIGMILALLNNIVKSNIEIKEDKWLREENRGRELNAMTVGIIGYGNCGQAVAKRLSSFGCNVFAHDKYKSGFGNDYVLESSLDQIQENVDILSLHIPLTKETHKMIDENFVSSFHSNFYFLNTSRGEIVDNEAIIKGLNSGKIIGAALDVLAPEGKAFVQRRNEYHLEYLLNHPKVIMTPHVAGWTVESYERINKVLIDKIKEAFIHNPP